MKKIGGNKVIEIQIRTVTKDKTGEQIKGWTTLHTIKGFLDISGGDSKYSTYNAKIQESTHFFICDYLELNEKVKSGNSIVFDPKTQEYYDIMYIDNPMELNKHLEFSLKYVGGQYGTEQ